MYRIIRTYLSLNMTAVHGVITARTCHPANYQIPWSWIIKVTMVYICQPICMYITGMQVRTSGRFLKQEFLLSLQARWKLIIQKILLGQEHMAEEFGKHL